MALAVGDRVQETATTTGTGTVTLAGAKSGFQAFGSVLSNADTTYYAIQHQTANEWETGLGTYTSSGTTLARTTVIASSNSNNAVDFAAGTKDVFITLPASKGIYLDASGNTTALGTVSSGTWQGGVIASAYLDADTAHLTGTQTFSGTKTFSDIDINGGNIDGTVIGASATAAISGTTGTFSGAITGTWEGTDIGVAYGGTGLSTVGTNQILTGNGTGALTSEANLTFDGQILDLNHASSNPTLTYSEGGTERGSVAYIPAANELRLIAKEAGSSMSLQTANSEAVYISSSQQVGIGTSNPSYPLEISASDGTSLAWQRTGGSAKKWGFVSDDNASYFRNITDTVDAIVVANAGSVGIGTATVGGSPGAGSVQFQKDANNYVRIWDNATATLYLQANGANAPTVAFKNSDSDSLDITSFQRTNAGATILGQSRNGLMALTGAPNGVLAIGTSNAKNLVFGTNNSPNLYLNTNGHLGVNVSDPQSLIEVSQDSASAQVDALRLTNESTQGYGAKLTFRQADTVVGSIKADNQTNDIWAMRLGTYTKETLLTLAENGKVGINIADPADYTDASGAVLVVGNTSSTPTRSGVAIITNGSGIGRLAFGDDTGDPDQWRGIIQYTQSSDAMGFATAGNAVGMTFVGDKLGIRTASPNANLDVVGNQGYTALFYGTSSGSDYTKINLTSNDRANLAHQRTASVGTSATTIFSQSAMGTYRDFGLVLVAGRVDSVNKFFYDIVVLVGSEDGSTQAIHSYTYGSGVAGRTYTTSSNTLQLAMASGTYKVRCVGLMTSSEQ